MVISDPLYDLPRNLEGLLTLILLSGNTRKRRKANILHNIGYGEEGFNPQWPNNAKIAISFILNYEEGSERTIINGDSQSEPYLWEKGASGGYREGHRYVNAESEYGSVN